MEKYVVTLTKDERDELTALTSKGKHQSQKILKVENWDRRFTFQWRCALTGANDFQKKQFSRTKVKYQMRLSRVHSV